MSIVKKLIPVLVFCLIAGLAGSGCNTMRGVGKDIQKGGEAVEDAAENLRYEMNVVPTGGHPVMASADLRSTMEPRHA